MCVPLSEPSELRDCESESEQWQWHMKKKQKNKQKCERVSECMAETETEREIVGEKKEWRKRKMRPRLFPAQFFYSFIGLHMCINSSHLLMIFLSQAKFKTTVFQNRMR